MTLEQLAFMEYALAKENWKRERKQLLNLSRHGRQLSHASANRSLIETIKAYPESGLARLFSHYVSAHKKAMAWAAVPYHRRNCGNCVQLARDSHWCFECYGDCPPDNSPITYANWRPAHPDYMETEYIRRLHAEKKGGAQ